MAGLSVLLETTTTTTAAKQQQLQCPQVVSKSTILNARTAMSSSPASSSVAVAPVLTTNSFLHRCFLCRRELADGVDIYIYRGDRAFCSEECRYRHILIEEDDDGAMDCAGVAAAGRSRRRRQAAAGEFAF